MSRFIRGVITVLGICAIFWGIFWVVVDTYGGKWLSGQMRKALSAEIFTSLNVEKVGLSLGKVVIKGIVLHLYNGWEVKIGNLMLEPNPRYFYNRKRGEPLFNKITGDSLFLGGSLKYPLREVGAFDFNGLISNSSPSTIPSTDSGGENDKTLSLIRERLKSFGHLLDWGREWKFRLERIKINTPLGISDVTGDVEIIRYVEIDSSAQESELLNKIELTSTGISKDTSLFAHSQTSYWWKSDLKSEQLIDGFYYAQGYINPHLGEGSALMSFSLNLSAQDSLLVKNAGFWLKGQLKGLIMLTLASPMRVWGKVRGEDISLSVGRLGIMVDMMG
ncbi:MAG: hypothetical protein ACK4OO_07690, partial [bacterium]